jgi:hypothetical protein
MTPEIIQIEDVSFDSDTQKVTVTAVLDDVVQVRGSSWFDPPEYGAARCETSFEIDDDVNYNDYSELEEYLQVADWNVVRDTYDDYID